MNDIVKKLIAAAPPILAANARTAGYCIFATRTGIEVLDYFGIPAEPIALEVQLFNKPLVDLYRAGIDDVATLKAAGAFAVATGLSSQITERRFSAHLMIDLIEGGLVDLNFGQFRRPEKGLVVNEAAWFHEFKPDGLWKPYDLPGGAMALLRPKENVAYTAAPDWQPARPVIGAIIRAIKKTASGGADK